MEISLFFKDLCSGKLLESSLDRMEQNIPVITTKLEKIFPCGFFYVMKHLSIHLVEEVRLGGPVQMRWMYPGERKIGECKQSIKQRGKIKGDVDDNGQIVEYFGVIQDILELRYPGWPKKKIILFRCKWFDPSHRGGIPHQKKLIRQ
ncbi:uncharacterized protein LOC107870789 isoform X2 [Capsicum annuum]|uniref:uncharacterized protein LOC107870789 isoform X2 n=1 Tax=Capsicum annuum TaxID=4072 RepID=UPI001FB0ADAA|nr:uncharacterized protein LOC107870789 isoform X2 [Capsicum annuum]